MKLEFESNNGAYDVWEHVNDDVKNKGTLVFDYEQDKWVYWPENIDDGVTYFNSLDETIQTIADELQADYYKD